MIDDMQESYDAEMKQMDAVGIDLNYEIRKTEELDEYELTALQERYEEEFKLEMTAASRVSAQLTMELQGVTIEQASKTFYVVEIDGVWYLDVFSFNS